LSLTPGIGPQRVAQLLDRIGPPSRIFSASAEQLRSVVPPRLAEALAAPDAQVLAGVEHALAWSAQPHRQLLPLTDPSYPALLRSTADPPTLLYLAGDPATLARPCLAIVGSRNATVNGQRTAAAFAAAASEAGIAIVSGMALGIDAAAHDGALRGCGSTVGVVATGIDRAYPARNRALFERVRAHGCLVGEMPLGTGPLGSLFPRRNRIISGLATAVLVVEAAVQSGSLVTARMAAAQGRQVMAVPGSIHSALSKGCHLLIKEGAMLVETIADAIDALGPGRFVPIAPQAAPGEGMHMPLLAMLGFAPTDPADLAAATGSAVDTVITQLLSLELNGLVQRLPGGMFQRLSS
jgi:DNA processing protein